MTRQDDYQGFNVEHDKKKRIHQKCNVEREEEGRGS